MNSKNNYDEIIALLNSKVKKKIDEIKNSKRKYKLISENVNDLIGVLNESIEYEYINEKAFLQTLGYNEHEIIGKCALNYIHPEDINHAITEFKNGFKNGYGSAEVRFKDKEGGWIWIEAKGKTFIDNEGEKKALIVSRDISERKKAEEKNKFLSSIAQQVKDAIIITNKQFEIVYINKATEDLYGYKKNEILGRSPDFLNAEPLAADIQEEIYQTVLSNKIWKGTHLNKRKDGSTFYGDFKISPLLDDEGEITYFTSVQRDVTDQKIARERLKESRERFRMLAEQALAGIFLIQDSVYKYVNKKFSDITGYSVEELLNWGPNEFFKLIHPEYRDFTKSQALKKLRGDTDAINQYEYKGIKRNGEIIWVEQYSNRIEYKGKVAILGIILDINDRKKAEKELKESEEKFRKITEQSFSGIAILQENDYVYANKKFAEILGYNHLEVQSWKLENYIERIHPDDREKVLEQAIKKQKGEKGVINHYEYRVIKKSGETIWIDNISGTITYNAKPADLINIIDITKRKKAEEELIRLNEMKTQLLSRISHELKTPLTSINGYLELLIKEYESLFDDSILEMIISNIREGTNRLNQIIKNVIKTIKIGSKNLELIKTKENLTELIRECVNDLKSLSDLRKHEVILKINENLLISVDSKQIREVISNLLINAYKFTPPGGRIEISAEKKEEEIIVYIKDNGIGITEKENKVLFSQFGKIEHFGKGLDVKIDGSGLGLYISKKIVNLHGGTIDVISSGRDEGSTFYFTLPRSQE